MTNSKLLKLAVITLGSAMALTAQIVSAEGMSCADWSYNDASCSAHIQSSGTMAESSIKQTTAGAFCADWSYSDPSCPAFPSATAAGSMQPSEAGMKGGIESSQCSDWSYNDKSCSAYITR